MPVSRSASKSLDCTLKAAICFDISRITRTAYLGSDAAARRFYKDKACAYLDTYGFRTPNRMMLILSRSDATGTVLHCTWKAEDDDEEEALQAAMNDFESAPPDPKFRNEHHILSVEFVSMVPYASTAYNADSAELPGDSATQAAFANTSAARGKQPASVDLGDEDLSTPASPEISSVEKAAATRLFYSSPVLSDSDLASEASHGVWTQTPRQDSQDDDSSQSAAQDQPTAGSSSSSSSRFVRTQKQGRPVDVSASPQKIVVSDNSTVDRFASPENEVWGSPRILLGPATLATEDSGRPLASSGSALSLSGSLFPGLFDLDVDAMFSAPLPLWATVAAPSRSTPIGQQDEQARAEPDDQAEQGSTSALASEVEVEHDVNATEAALESAISKVQTVLAERKSEIQRLREQVEEARLARRIQSPLDRQTTQLRSRIADRRRRCALLMQELRRLRPDKYNPRRSRSATN
ncbi:uncharacterized protein B0H18DRAFT_1214143 [Fomitopsis serialis]|uniref:uncharacterized protein n=1 Tax=Fomitopsis serialis TaxID=139415 RepID=UPI002008D5E1|nr:uncharacterized protein B0H18DRAFT_1214143 [Neoantrodia serialis]KAH9918601.1 hypothetical protein B0H18DRAFT_1214143 [Neoantrodia serialis]